MSVDPLQKRYPELTPYQFASNTPIQGVDLDGREVYHYLLLKGSDGKPYLRYQGEQTREFATGEVFDKASPATRYMNAQGDKITTKTIRVWLNPEPIPVLNEIWGATRDFDYFKQLNEWEGAGFPAKPVDPAEVEAQRKAGEAMAQQATMQLMFMTLGNQIDMADGDIDGYGTPSILPGKTTKTSSPSTNTNKQVTSANNGNTAGANANTGTNTKPSTLRPGPYAKESIPAKNTAQTFTLQERAAINKIGGENGCHTSGVKIPGTKSGNWVPDHQPSSAISPAGTPQVLLPHCIGCSRKQGGDVSVEKRNSYKIKLMKYRKIDIIESATEFIRYKGAYKLYWV